MKALVSFPNARSVLSQGALVVVLGSAVLAWVSPASFEAFAQEDGIAEWATFVSFFTAFVLFALAALRTVDRWPRLFFLGVAAFCLFVAGEEISWGQRLFAFQPPKVFLEHNYQQEANLHNLLKNILDTRWIVLAVALLYGVAWPLVARRLQGVLQNLAPSPALAPGFFAVAVLEAAYPFNLAGEVAELALGLGFLAEALVRRDALSFRWIPALQAACFAASLAIVPINDHLLYGDDEVAAAKTKDELDRLAKEVMQPSVYRKKIFKKRRVHKRVYTAVRAGYLRFSPEARTEWGYFLDAWNQPLWLETQRIDRDRARAVLYSFGPNRRRDDDDIKVTFELSRSQSL
jgi:hypothetical protein